jgi:hypothetical protein
MIVVVEVHPEVAGVAAALASWWTHKREAATGPHLNLKSIKKINFGNCQPLVLTYSVITNIWQPSYNSFSDK